MLTALLWCDKMYKNISKKLLHLTIEFFGSKKYRKKCLTKSTTFDIIIELSERRASRTLKIEQY